MLVNQRIKEIRVYRRLEGRGLASMAGLSAGEISHIDRNLRTPKTDTLQRIARALDVTISFLLGEDEDAKLPLAQALACQSLKVFLLHTEVSPAERDYVGRIKMRDSAPQTVRGWSDLLRNLHEYEFSDQRFPSSDSLS
jgi:transcriptional regulator with XRE-family HTH domain